MSEKRDIPSIKKKVCQAIDLDEWQHSWHLPKDSNGNTDWYSIETYAEVKRVIERKMADADARLSFLGGLYFDEVDWQYPLRQLEDDLSTLEYCILENDVGPGETVQDLMEERKRVQALIDKYESALGDEKSISKDVEK